ncbi:MAG: hypothetical protein JO228_15085, partial [Xanthobacteraceae bacterium]|nr:hypothetical protein [Xanthobacteraceae bacterium]
MFRLFRPRFPAATIDSLYGVIVAQARTPVFYEEFGVADTVDGRFELIVLHLALLTRRLARETEGAALGRMLVDRFGRDMDDNLREMGVGDLAVPKKMKRIFEALYGRTRVYGNALKETGSDSLERALARNVFGGREGAVARLAAYVRCATGELDAAGASQILAGRLAFPSPRAILPDMPEKGRKLMKRPEGWHVLVRREEVPETGLHLEIEADAEVRARLAALAGILGMPQLSVIADVARHGEGLRASGRVTGRVSQSCVVTLEPIENAIDEPFDVLFLPPDLVGASPAAPEPEEVDDTREPLVDGAADLGAVAMEFFLLGIDPYPRKAGAVFAAPTG